MGVVGKYVETFVREAIARAAWERGLVEKEGRGAGPEVEFLEVSVLLVFQGGREAGEKRANICGVKG